MLGWFYWCMSFFFFKQKTAYEMRISDWSSDVCSSDLSLCPAAGWRCAVETARAVGAVAGSSRCAVVWAGVRSAQVAPGQHLCRRLSGDERGLPDAQRLDARARQSRAGLRVDPRRLARYRIDRKSTRLNSSH